MAPQRPRLHHRSRHTHPPPQRPPRLPSLIADAGLRPVRLHDLRHTAASLLLAQGVAARVVMELLGHSQIGITLNTYTHVDPELNRDAAERLEKPLSEGDAANG